MTYEDAVTAVAFERIKAGKFIVSCADYTVLEDKYTVEVRYHTLYHYTFKFDTPFEMELFLDQLEKIGGYTDREKFDRENNDLIREEVSKKMHELLMNNH